MKTGIALGSNLGDRHANIEAGFQFLKGLTSHGHWKKSGLLQTDPVDCPPGSPVFLNAVVEIEWDGELLDLLHRLQQFELKMGRPKVREVNAPRPLDLDILYAGNIQMNLPELTLPHPRMLQRYFVLRPLCDIQPDLILPGQRRTVKELLAQLP